VIGDGWRAHKEHQPECDSACTPRVFVDPTVKALLVSAVEEVVGGVGHQLSLAYRAGGRRNSSSSGIQALNEGGFGQEVPAGGPLLVPYGLQLEALNRTSIRATRNAGVRVDSSGLHSPHPAAIEGPLPCRVPAERRSDTWLGTFVDALEVGDDLELLPEEIRKEGGLGTGAGVPRGATCACRQASIALATESVADQVQRVSVGHCDLCWRLWGREILRQRVLDCAEGTCEHEGGHEQGPNSRSLLSLLIKVAAHLFVLQFSMISMLVMAKFI
jgi:hypothetical protein